MSSRIDFVGHKVVDYRDLAAPYAEADNIVVDSEEPELQWIKESTELIGEWRAIVRSAYLGWAITINGIHVASEKYSNPEWMAQYSFKTDLVRSVDGEAKVVPFIWDSHKVAEAHLRTQSMLCSHGLVELYSCLEELIFDFYKVYWKHNPEILLLDEQFRDLREFAKYRADEPEAWEKSLNERIDLWKKKKSYESLSRVFLAYCKHAELSTPGSYQQTTIETWAECIRHLGMLRNCITHAITLAPKELEEFSTKPYRMGFSFKEGDEIIISVTDLMNVESFCNSLLTALNISLFERARAFYSQRGQMDGND